MASTQERDEDLKETQEPGNEDVEKEIEEIIVVVPPRDDYRLHTVRINGFGIWKGSWGKWSCPINESNEFVSSQNWLEEGFPENVIRLSEFQCDEMIDMNVLKSINVSHWKR
ncbi:uncharacterized protein LOC113309341 [Papaver somniferum]|uniref:uncharacterized protein LOC113309341 n=1 Tax=Papaver somniferum TaxID=3469 RepID=UPI000E703277|nr:uncharacterized protein LOC113309341 [Papaver somniferum]